MKIISKSKRNFSIIIFLFIAIILYYFVGLVSSGTHGLIEEFSLNLTKKQILIKIDSLVIHNDNVRFIANDYIDYYDVFDVDKGVIFTYKIVQYGGNSSSIGLIYVKEESENVFKDNSELRKREKENYVLLFQNLIVQPICECM